MSRGLGDVYKRQEKCPVEKLAELWVSYQPQMNDYILRAVDPSQAPSYGVPGDI